MVAASVPELAEEEGALGVHRIHDGLPCLHLVVAPEPGHTRVPRRRLLHRAGLGDEEDARRRPLLVVEGVVRLRQVLQRPAARHRRKNNPATTNTIRTKKIKHG